MSLGRLREHQYHLCIPPFQVGGKKPHSSWTNKVDIYSPRPKNFDQTISVQLEGTKVWEKEPGTKHFDLKLRALLHPQSLHRVFTYGQQMSPYTKATTIPLLSYNCVGPGDHGIGVWNRPRARGGLRHIQTPEISSWPRWPVCPGLCTHFCSPPGGHIVW